MQCFFYFWKQYGPLSKKKLPPGDLRTTLTDPNLQLRFLVTFAFK